MTKKSFLTFAERLALTGALADIRAKVAYPYGEPDRKPGAKASPAKVVGDMVEFEPSKGAL
jgi:hypothetical protein